MKKEFRVHFKDKTVKDGHYVIDEHTAHLTERDFMAAMSDNKFILLGTRHYAIDTIAYVEFEGELAPLSKDCCDKSCKGSRS